MPGNDIEPDKEFARCVIGERLRELFANLLRMSRSPDGGAPHHLTRQVVELAEELKRYYRIAGQGLPADKLQQMVLFEHRYRDPNYERRAPTDYALELISTGAAQVMASRMLGQWPQEL